MSATGAVDNASAAQQQADVSITPRAPTPRGDDEERAGHRLVLDRAGSVVFLAEYAARNGVSLGALVIAGIPVACYLGEDRTFEAIRRHVAQIRWSSAA